MLWLSAGAVNLPIVIWWLGFSIVVDAAIADPSGRAFDAVIAAMWTGMAAKLLGTGMFFWLLWAIPSRTRSYRHVGRRMGATIIAYMIAGVMALIGIQLMSLVMLTAMESS